MTARAPWIVLPIAVVLGSCGGGDAGADAGTDAPPASESEAPASETPSGDFDRESFVLCPALEPHREELASILGFEQDAERDLAGLGSECILRGTDHGFVSVALPPAVIRSVSMHVDGFDAETSPAPELGPEAVFVDATLQPHVVFMLGPLIIDVGAESRETPSRETMIELATRVREILAEANS